MKIYSYLTAFLKGDNEKTIGNISIYREIDEDIYFVVHSPFGNYNVYRDDVHCWENAWLWEDANGTESKEEDLYAWLTANVPASLFLSCSLLFSEPDAPEMIDFEMFELSVIDIDHYLIKYMGATYDVTPDHDPNIPDGIRDAIVNYSRPKGERIGIILNRIEEVMNGSSTWSAPDGLSIEDISGSEDEFTVMCDGYCGKIVLSRDNIGFYMFKVDSFARLQSDIFILSFLEIVI